MKRLLVMLICLLFYTGPTATAAATIDGIWLNGTKDPTFRVDTWAIHGILGVSQQGQFALLNKDDPIGGYCVPNLSLGKYDLFLNSPYIESTLKFIVYFSDKTYIETTFDVLGSNGSGQSWNRVSGSPLLTLGWGTVSNADLVGDKYIGSDGKTDFMFNIEVKANAVPIPAAAWLLGSGLLGLVALKRRLQR